MPVRTVDTANIDLPFRYEPQEVILRSQENRSPFSFSVITNDSGEHMAILRNPHEPGVAGTFSDKLRALDVLAASGVEVASHLGIRVAPSKDLLVVEYVNGPHFDTQPHAVTPDRVLDHAIGLGRYLCRALLEEDYVLSDITETAQYRVRNGGPVLVDLDAYLDSSFEIRPVVAEHRLQTIHTVYAPLLPADHANALRESVESFKNELLHP